MANKMTPNVTEVKVLNNYKIFITFESGEKKYLT